MPPEAPRRFQFTLRKALLAFVVLSFGMLVLSAGRSAFRWLALPAPIRAFRSNRAAYERVAAEVLSGKLTYSRERQSIIVKPDSLGYRLANDGTRYVRQAGTCIEFSFEFMPTDAIPLLVYSPNGPTAIPARSGIYEIQQLAPNWFYVRRE